MARLRAALQSERTAGDQVRGQLDHLLAQMRQAAAEIAATAARLMSATDPAEG